MEVKFNHFSKIRHTCVRLTIQLNYKKLYQLYGAQILHAKIEKKRKTLRALSLRKTGKKLSIQKITPHICFTRPPWILWEAKSLQITKAGDLAATMEHIDFNYLRMKIGK